MKVQCHICDEIEELNDRKPLAKKIKYNCLKSYLCDECYERIRINTIKRHETGEFSLYDTSK